ncbi:MAG: membrane dipeptidase [Clostridiales bacterium]|nr:membrane dipeptidase [Clostridiales bacterium]
MPENEKPPAMRVDIYYMGENKMKKERYIIDAHCDTLCILSNGHTIREDNNEINLSVERLKKGNVGLQCFAAFVSVQMINVAPMVRAQILIDQYEKLLLDDAFMRVKSYADIQNAIDSGKIGAMLTLEGGDVLEGDINNLYKLYDKGARMLTLTWSNKNELADGIAEEDGTGLTQFGRDVVSEMERLGMVVDVSHLSNKGFWDVMEMAKKPIVASHSNALSLCSHMRNLSDDQLKALKQNGGVTGINFCASFLENNSNATLDNIVRHIEYINSLIGEGHVGFGSDYDGVDNNLPRDGRDPSCFDEIAERLLRLNYSEKSVADICHGNFLRVFSEVLK